MNPSRLSAVAAALLLSCAAAHSQTEAAAPKSAVMTKAAQESTTPEDALRRLLAGNERFRAGHPLPRDAAADVKATAPAQFPFAAVLSCIDSRVPPEMVFDAGLGDLFSARVAGNVVDDDVLGSLEYATKAAGARLILVLGHTHCGAVKAACEGVTLEHVTALLDKIAPVIPKDAARTGAPGKRDQAFIDDVAQRNVRQSMKELTERSAVIRELVKSGRIAVRGALYDVETGAVRLLD